MATIHWISGNGGSWNTATNWSPGTVPGFSDDAVIDASGSYTVTLGVPITVGSIAVSDSSATLAVNDSGQTETVTVGLTSIKECQLDLYADRTSTATMRANQLRLWLSSFAYVLLCGLRRIALHHTKFAKATCGS